MIRALLLAAFAAAAPVVHAATPALMPMPVKVETAAGKLVIDGTFGVTGIAGEVPRLNRVVEHFLARVARQTGIFFAPGAKAATLQVECAPRSEEHTSELQSLRHLVCRL